MDYVDPKGEFDCATTVDPNPLWPATLLRTVANFRVDDELRNYALVGIFVLRFMLGNLSNGLYQAKGQKLPISTLASAFFFSCCSLYLLGCANTASFPACAVLCFVPELAAVRTGLM